MAIPGRAAPLSGTRQRTVDPSELAALQQRATSQGSVPVPEVDPTLSPQNMIRNIPQVDIDPNVPRGRELLTQYDAVPETLEEIAQLTGSPFGANTIQEPILDAQGNIVFDEQGNPRYRTQTPEDYATEMSIARGSQRDFSQAFDQFSMDPERESVPFIQQTLRQDSDAAFNASDRVTAKKTFDEDEVDRYADKNATTLTGLVNKTYDSLFTDNARIKVEVASKDPMVPNLTVSAGIKIAADAGYVDEQSWRKLASVFGIALAKAATQSKLNPEDKGAKAPTSESGNRIDDTQYLFDAINSVKHFATNGLNNIGMQMKPGQVESMAKAVVQDAIARGEMVAFNDPKTQRPLVTVNRDLKDISKGLQRFAEAVLGDTSRNRSSTVANRSGAGWNKGKPQTTKKSLDAPGIVTTAADATKDVLGSVGLVFRAKDVAFANAALGLMLNPDFVQTDSKGMIKWSTHPFAKRYGISKKDFDTARSKVSVPEGFNPQSEADVRNFERLKDEQATQVIDSKIKELKFAISNVAKSPGIRYSEWIHSIANQRFFPNSFDVDYMGSKAGIRDMLGLAVQDYTRPEDLFDFVNKVPALKEKAISIFRKNGKAQHEALEQLQPAELGAIGAMMNAVYNYFTAVDPGKVNITKLTPAEVINLYDQAIADKMAELGAKYNDFLKNPQEADETIIGFLAGMEKGESLGSKNLWDDFFNMKANFRDPMTRRKSYQLTHHSFDDGNQNGIFLQALFFGGQKGGANATRLGTYNPNLADMRVFGMNTMVHQLQEMLNDQPEKSDGWREFWRKAIELKGKDAVAKDFFKAPLMQHAYGKDAFMFNDVLYSMIDADPTYADIAQETLLGRGYNHINEMVDDLTQAVGLALQEVIDAKGSKMMQRIGRYTAVLNTPVFLEGITGDTYVLTPVNVRPINKSVSSDNSVKAKTSDGKEIYLKKKQYVEDTFVTPEGTVSIPSSAMQLSPSAAKPTQYFLNRETMKYDEFHNPLGTAQMRMMAVMPIQSLDGDLVKWTTLFVNKERMSSKDPRNPRVPRPVLWVHDSIISTPGSALLYRNAYNNVAIPQAIPEIAKMGKKFQQVVNESKRREIARVTAKGEPVGIGSEGDYPALGDLFNELYDKIDPRNESFKDRFIKRNARTGGPDKAKADYQRYIEENKKILSLAEEAGWVPPDKLTPEQRKYIAVTPKQFSELVSLAGRVLNMEGPKEQLTDWANNFQARTMESAKILYNAARNGGIAQMTPGGGAPAVKVTKEPVQNKVPEKSSLKGFNWDDMPTPDF